MVDKIVCKTWLKKFNKEDISRGSNPLTPPTPPLSGPYIHLNRKAY